MSFWIDILFVLECYLSWHCCRMKYFCSSSCSNRRRRATLSEEKNGWFDFHLFDCRLIVWVCFLCLVLFFLGKINWYSPAMGNTIALLNSSHIKWPLLLLLLLLPLFTRTAVPVMKVFIYHHRSIIGRRLKTTCQLTTTMKQSRRYVKWFITSGPALRL